MGEIQMNKNLDAAIKKLQEDLDWKSPSGIFLHEIVLERHLAEAILEALMKREKQ
jgi:hypothetical protein